MLNFLNFNHYNYYPPVHPNIDLRYRLPRQNLNKLIALNVGIGTGNSTLGIQLPLIHFKKLDIIDIHQPYLDRAMARTYAAEEVEFIKADIRNFHTIDYDIVLMFDILEHLEKQQSIKIIRNIQCKQVIFIPLEKEFRTNIYEAESQEHKSLWTEADFKGLGYRTEVLKNFHHEDNKVFDALWALKN